MSAVAEGVRTTGAALALGARHDVELPIAAQMAEVLSGRRTPREAARGAHGAAAETRGGVMSLVGRLRAGLRRTAERLTARLASVTGAEGPGRDGRGDGHETLAALEEMLIEADVGVLAAERIVARAGEAERAGREPPRAGQAGDARDPWTGRSPPCRRRDRASCSSSA